MWHRRLWQAAAERQRRLLHQRGDITLAHARVLRRWGDAGRAPDPAHPKQIKDLALWTEALTRLEVLLREKSIIATM